MMEMLPDSFLPIQNKGRYFGVTIGIVTNNQDPDGLDRVKVRLPWLSDDCESHWARVMTPMAGPERGFYFLPEVDDEVLVAFEHGRIDFPYVLGALWNGRDTPPEKGSDRRVIKSRSGHIIVLDDRAGDEKIVVRDKTGKNEITIFSNDDAISVKSNGELTLEAQGKISIKSGSGDILINGNNISLEATQNLSSQAHTGLAIKCPVGVKINDGALEIV